VLDVWNEGLAREGRFSPFSLAFVPRPAPSAAPIAPSSVSLLSLSFPSSFSGLVSLHVRIACRLESMKSQFSSRLAGVDLKRRAPHSYFLPPSLPFFSSFLLFPLMVVLHLHVGLSSSHSGGIGL